MGEDGPSSRMIKIVVSEQVDVFRAGWVCGNYFLRKLITSNISKRITEEFRLHNPCAEKSIGGLRAVGVMFPCEHLQAIAFVKRIDNSL